MKNAADVYPSKCNASAEAMPIGSDFDKMPADAIRPKGQPLRWKDSEPGAYDRTDVPEDIKRKYKFYYRDEKGNEFYVAKDYVMPVDVACQIRFGMSFAELAEYILGKYYEQKKREAGVGIPPPAEPTLLALGRPLPTKQSFVLTPFKERREAL